MFMQLEKQHPLFMVKFLASYAWKFGVCESWDIITISGEVPIVLWHPHVIVLDVSFSKKYGYMRVETWLHLLWLALVIGWGWRVHMKCWLHGQKLQVSPAYDFTSCGYHYTIITLISWQQSIGPLWRRFCHLNPKLVNPNICVQKRCSQIDDHSLKMRVLKPLQQRNQDFCSSYHYFKFLPRLLNSPNILFSLPTAHSHIRGIQEVSLGSLLLQPGSRWLVWFKTPEVGGLVMRFCRCRKVHKNGKVY